MLRYKTETRPGLVALYDTRSGNGVGQFLQPGARMRRSMSKDVGISTGYPKHWGSLASYPLCWGVPGPLQKRPLPYVGYHIELDSCWVKRYKRTYGETPGKNFQGHSRSS